MIVFQIVNTFARSIIRSDKEKNFNEIKAREFVSFLIDECLDIFTTPAEYSNEVDEAIVSVDAFD